MTPFITIDDKPPDALDTAARSARARPVVKRLCAALSALALAGALAACGGDDDEPPSAEVSTWNQFASTLVAANQAPAFQVHTLALVQIAVYDALNAIEPRYAAYAYTGRAAGA
jgi:hypothetical protein